MPAIVSMLRGVNLGPHRRIKMDALRDLYVALDLEDPRTYLQSGNVVFKTDERDLVSLARRIENAIERRFGFRADVIVRTSSEMRRAIARNPFAARRGLDPSRLLVTFLAADPGRQALDKVRAIKTDPEELHIHAREIYTYFPNGMARPRVSWAAIENVLKVSGTGRNWNSVTKLLELAEAMES